MGRKFILDIDEDRAALGIMHAYMFARGANPDEVLRAVRKEDITTPARQVWFDAAQELANNPDTYAGCLAPEWAKDFTSPIPHYDIAAVIVKEKAKESVA